METKFAVGQVWKDGYGDQFTIREIWEGGYSFRVRTNKVGGGGGEYSFTITGSCFGDDSAPSAMDLVELVQNADGSPAASSSAITSLTPAEMSDPTRAEFIDSLVLQEFDKAVDGWDADDAEKMVRHAVKLRDELVRGM